MACSDRSKAELCSFHEADHTFVTEQAVYTEVQTETETWWRAGESGGGVQEREAGDKQLRGVGCKVGDIHIWNGSKTYRRLSLGSLKKRHMTRMAGVACLEVVL